MIFMAVIVYKDRTIKEVKAEELQRMLKDQVAKAKIFSWLYIKQNITYLHNKLINIKGVD